MPILLQAAINELKIKDVMSALMSIVLVCDWKQCATMNLCMAHYHLLCTERAHRKVTQVDQFFSLMT